MRADWRDHLEQEFEAGQDYKPNKTDWLDGAWTDLRTADADEQRRGKTGLPVKTLKEIGKKLTDVPKAFNVHRTIQRFLDNRAKMIETGEGIDWATARSPGVRLAGRRGSPGAPVRPGRRARHLQPAPFGALRSGDRDSAISRSTTLRQSRRATRSSTRCSRKRRCSASNTATRCPTRALTLWEAQFGDFANGAQVVDRPVHLLGRAQVVPHVGPRLLLPHGYEGQGPEHSSARLERYLQLCAEDNMQVANCTTPANYFHVLRRQMKRDFRKPLILMTPKSLLRHKRAVSSLAEMTGESCFHRLLWDDAEAAGRPADQAAPGRRSAASSSARARSITTCSRIARSAASTTSICCASNSSIRSRPRP